MSSFTDEVNRDLATLREQGLYRELRRVDSPCGAKVEIGGRSLLNFSSNDYLGLASHPALKEAAIKCIESYGAGSGASRLICGSLAPFHELEEALAAFKRTEASLTFSTGYAAAVGTLTAVAGKDDIVILDKLVHASIVDGAKLTGAKLRVFRHNDLDDLEAKLKWADENRRQPGRVLVVTESVFSMDGDVAPLREIVALKEKHGAWLMVDEAHATGIFGEHGRGLADALAVSSQVEIQMGTLGKALGASGGFICGSRALIDYLINRARSFIFSTASVPAAAAAAREAIRLVQAGEGESRRKDAWNLANQLKLAAGAAGLKLDTPQSLIMPVVIGDEAMAVATAAALREQGIFVPAIRYPTVARGAARLRITLTAAHTPQEVGVLATTLVSIFNRRSQTT